MPRSPWTRSWKADGIAVIADIAVIARDRVISETHHRRIKPSRKRPALRYDVRPFLNASSGESLDARTLGFNDSWLGLGRAHLHGTRSTARDLCRAGKRRRRNRGHGYPGACRVSSRVERLQA